MSLFWYDFETFGADPARDRPSQFAGIRTDEDFNPIGEPVEIYCKPADDMLPHPEACLITRITPELANERGVTEAEFIRQIHREFAEPNTCVLGYNSIRFDDEVTRHCLYRNFYDPYAREWQNGNSRWDIIDMVRLTRAVRPEGINWPDHEDGRPSFKLDHLTEANNIEQVGAHDALVDVRATIEIARLIRQRQPKLYEYVYSNRGKRHIEQQLNLVAQKPVLHISSKYPADRGCAAVVVPIARDRINKNAIYVYDLSVDPQALLELDAEQINRRVFTAADQLPVGESRIPIKAIHINKCPVIVPAKLVTDEVAERIGVDVSACLANLNKLKAAGDISGKVQDAFSLSNFEASTDPDLMLYSGGFFSPHDRQLMDQIHETDADVLATLSLPFQDQRLSEMLFRYRARNFPQTLTIDEQDQWREYRIQRMTDEQGGGSITLAQLVARIDQMKAEESDENRLAILSSVEHYAQSMAGELDIRVDSSIISH